MPNKGFKHSAESKRAISNSLSGCTRSSKTRERMSKCKTGEKNARWKGDDVGLGALHIWMRKEMQPMPVTCPRCKKRKTRDLSNKGVYDRDKKNWEWLCRYCHMEEDGRLTSPKLKR